MPTYKDTDSLDVEWQYAKDQWQRKYEEAVKLGKAMPDPLIQTMNLANPECDWCHGNYLHMVEHRHHGDEAIEYRYECTRCGHKQRNTTDTPPKAKEAKQMNQYTDTLNMLHLDRDVPTAAVDFTKGGHAYTYKCSPELHAQLEAGDLVLLTVGDTDYSSARPVFKIGVVAEVHEHSQIKFGSESQSYEWIIQRLDKDGAFAIKESERKIIEKLAHAQAKKQVREAMGEIPEDVWGLIEGGTAPDVIDHQSDDEV